MDRNLDRAETLLALRNICRGTARSLGRSTDERLRLSTGLPGLDSLLPDQGLEPGWVVEWLAPVEGCGVAVLALQGVRTALGRQSAWAVIDGGRDDFRKVGNPEGSTGKFYPLAAQGWGVSLESLLWLRPSSVADAAWAVEQCLRCPAVGVTWFQSDLVPDRVLQRWKIAAETGGGIGVLFRPSKAARQASWADVRWLVHPQPSVNAGRQRVRVELLSCRGACRLGESVDLDVCDVTGEVRLVSTVTSTASAVRSIGG